MGSEKSMPFTMMLSKALKVAIECVQRTPVEMPTCNPLILDISLLSGVKDCFKTQWMNGQC